MKQYKLLKMLNYSADVDECADSEVCEGGKCVNTDGGFQCECPPDWRLSTDGTYCICKL